MSGIVSASPATSIFLLLPRRFLGGDLLRYDTNVEADRNSSVVFSQIEPLNNTLALFPSDSLSRNHPYRGRHARLPGWTVHHERLGPIMHEDGTVGEYKGEGKVRTARLRKGKGLSLSLVHNIHVPLQTDSRALLIVAVILHTRGRPRLGSQ